MVPWGRAECRDQAKGEQVRQERRKRKGKGPGNWAGGGLQERLSPFEGRLESTALDKVLLASLPSEVGGGDLLRVKREGKVGRK